MHNNLKIITTGLGLLGIATAIIGIAEMQRLNNLTFSIIGQNFSTELELQILASNYIAHGQWMSIGITGAVIAALCALVFIGSAINSEINN
jgi:hypothetical protein